MYAHALVVGGTGMLAEATLRLATAHRQVSVLARGKARLEALARRSGSIRQIACDYRDDRELSLAISDAIRLAGPVELAVCWIHEIAPRALGIVAREIAGRDRPACRLFHVVGSAHADPTARAAAYPDPSVEAPGITYRQIVLGFVLEGAGSRWLSDREISAGVSRAIESDLEFSVVGVVRPWGRRP